MRLRIAELFMLAAVALCAQTQGDAEHTVRLVHVKYAGSRAATLLNGVSGVTIKQSNEDFLLTGAPHDLDTVEAMLKRLADPPPTAGQDAPRNLEITAYLIIASPQAMQNTALPKELEAVAAQVGAVFPYKSYALLDSVVVRSSNFTGGNANGILPAGPFSPQGWYSFRYQTASANAADSIHLANLTLNMQVRTGTTDKEGRPNTSPVGFETSLDLKPGQKAVIGKANIDASDKALIVVLTGKVVD